MRIVLHAAPYSILARSYDRVLGHANFRRTRRAFERLVREYRIRFRNAADAGCGTGLFARYLSRCWGVPVYAVDRAPAMLRAARRNCSMANVMLLRQDLRRMRLPSPVDLVTSNFDTLNHLASCADLRQALRSIAENLRPGGHFLFDFLTPCQPLKRETPYVRRVRGMRNEVQQWVRWDPKRRAISIRILHITRGAAPPLLECHHERAYALQEMGQALLDAGFSIRGVHDADTLRKVEVCAPRLIVVAQKCPLHRAGGCAAADKNF